MRFLFPNPGRRPAVFTAALLPGREIKVAWDEALEVVRGRGSESALR
jgi:hypothetical protein